VDTGGKIQKEQKISLEKKVLAVRVKHQKSITILVLASLRSTVGRIARARVKALDFPCDTAM